MYIVGEVSGPVVGVELIVHVPATSARASDALAVVALPDACAGGVTGVDRWGREPDRCHRLLHEELGAGGDRARRLVEDEQRGVGQEGTGNGDELLLTGRDVRGLVVEHRVVAVR